MKKIIKNAKRLFWKLPLSSNFKEKLRVQYATYKDKGEVVSTEMHLSADANCTEYTNQILAIPNNISEEHIEFIEHKDINQDVDIIAYYLTQYHPNTLNDMWWGKGTTEWTNVSKAVPQFLSHYQPRLPGELGYYDLRLRENMARQIELAKNYGVNVFCYYYYWFDGKRLLEKPLNMFLKDKLLDMTFCICWANENWTKRFSGTNSDVLMKVGDTAESCISFIYDILEIIVDERYYCIDGKAVLVIYRPSIIVDTRKVICKWREIVLKQTGKELYIVAVQEKSDSRDWCRDGYDAETEFQPKRINNIAKDITHNVNPLRFDFKGSVYDYKDLVEKRKYKIKENQLKKVYPAVMPMWDNTARRNNNATVYHGATPALYKKWLKDSIYSIKNNKQIDKKSVFINAWNEWGEGAYLEPDRYWGYAYLEATYQSLKECMDV